MKPRQMHNKKIMSGAGIEKKMNEAEQVLLHKASLILLRLSFSTIYMSKMEFRKVSYIP